MGKLPNGFQYGENYSDPIFMKPIFTQVGFCIRSLRESRRRTQESLATECRQCGFAVTRQMLANYELGLSEVPARLIPIIAHVLKADITDLLPPLDDKAEFGFTLELEKIRNLTGQQIQAFRKKRKWSQRRLAAVIREMGAPITREIIANLETQRTRVKDYQLVFLAKALQIPVNSLFPNGANLAVSSLENPLPDRQNKTHLTPGPLARAARKIGKFAKRIVTRQKSRFFCSTRWR
jgi:transcriptional regulator with XRE-family HTH domain